jgi:acetyl-CoA carboxylase carboxyltransferase component
MCSKHLGADFVFAWPSAEIAVMGARGAVDVLYAKQMKNVDDKEAFRTMKEQEYNKKFLSPDIAVKLGYVDDIIRPQDTRDKLFMFLWILRNKKATTIPDKRHGNIPL